MVFDDEQLLYCPHSRTGFRYADKQVMIIVIGEVRLSPTLCSPAVKVTDVIFCSSFWCLEIIG